MPGVLIVTGAGRGIGAACARAGGSLGYKVCVNYNKSASRAVAVAADIVKAGGKAITVEADIATEAGVKSLFETVDRNLGTVTALVNNAGTILAQSRVEAPMMVIRPFELPDGRLVVQLITLGPGLCGGDAIDGMGADRTGHHPGRCLRDIRDRVPGCAAADP